MRPALAEIFQALGDAAVNERFRSERYLAALDLGL
jgi:hypothetical protein